MLGHPRKHPWGSSWSLCLPPTQFPWSRSTLTVPHLTRSPVNAFLSRSIVCPRTTNHVWVWTEIASLAGRHKESKEPYPRSFMLDSLSSRFPNLSRDGRHVQTSTVGGTCLVSSDHRLHMTEQHRLECVGKLSNASLDSTPTFAWRELKKHGADGLRTAAKGNLWLDFRKHSTYITEAGCFFAHSRFFLWNGFSLLILMEKDIF